MPSQSQSGKAFEFALINAANNYFYRLVSTSIITDQVYNIARNCYNIYNATAQQRYNRAAVATIRHIVQLEPRLNHPNSLKDILELRLMPDASGQHGDVRDVLFIRSAQGWEIGISAKNNHKAVKHSRLSDNIDFGQKWLNIPCSNAYFTSINPIFQRLRLLQIDGAVWNRLPNKHQNYYQPVLQAFRTELLRINANYPSIPQALVSYLIGNKDFYKAIKRNGVTEILGFNINGTLNNNARNSKPVIKVPRLILPTQIIQIAMKQNSSDTLIMTCDNGWALSFRIHNASTMVEPSLKFDINLEGHPQSLYSHHEPW